MLILRLALISVLRLPFGAISSGRLVALTTILLPLLADQRTAIALLSYLTVAQALMSISSEADPDEAIFPAVFSLMTSMPDGSNVRETAL